MNRDHDNYIKNNALNILRQIDFTDLDIQIIEQLNQNIFSAAWEITEKEYSATQWRGEKTLLLSRLLALCAIEDSTTSRLQLRSLCAQMLETVSLSSEETSLLKSFVSRHYC